MASISKRRGATGVRWLAQVRCSPYKPVSRMFVDRPAAVAWAEALEASLRSARRAGGVRGDAGRLTVRQLVDEYRVDPSFAGLRSSPDRLDQLLWFVARIGNERVVDLGVIRLRQLRSELVASRSPATANRYLAAMRACWNWGILAGLVPGDRGWPRRLMLREGGPRQRFLSVEELRRLLLVAYAIDVRLWGVVQLAVLTGLRQGELLRLRVGDLDLARRSLVVLVSKTDRPRAVHLPGPALSVAQVLVGDRPAGAPLLALEDGSPWRPGQLVHAWKRARAAAGLGGFRFHDLRHTAASWLAQNGASLVEVGAVLGHRSPAVTARYAHLVAGRAVTGHAELGELVEAALGVPAGKPEG